MLLIYGNKPLDGAVMKINNRIHGLDTLRSVAIILVFMFHYTCFVSEKPTFGFFGDIGWVGVNIFLCAKWLFDWP